MSRISYSDEEDYPGQFALWNGNVNRSLQGKRGRAALRFLRESLLALPEKRLIANAIARDGEVCAIGAVLVHRQPDPLLQAYELAYLETIDDDEDTTEYAPMDFPQLVAWAIVSANDYTFSHLTPELRYEKMLAWVEARLAGKRIE